MPGYTLGHLGSHLYSFPLETYFGACRVEQKQGSHDEVDSEDQDDRSCGRQIAEVGDRSGRAGAATIQGLELTLVGSPLCALCWWLFGFYVNTKFETKYV